MKQWLTNAKAAELLIVSERTIKRWMTRPAARGPLGAVKHGKQWRIPLLDDESAWAFQTDRRLRAAGVLLKPLEERDLEKYCKQFDRYSLESYRFWLAAYTKAATRGVITQEGILRILLLWQTACKILSVHPEGTEVNKLKSKFPDELRARNFSEDEILAIMSCWPAEKCFKPIRAARTLKQLEKIRRGVDFTQAAKTCQHLGKKTTAENLQALCHKNIMEHINDTREELPAFVLDWREPQNGLVLRTFRNRHPLRQFPQRDIVATVYGARDSIPGADERPCSGKTPIRT